VKFQHDTSPVWPSASCLAFWDVEYMSLRHIPLKYYNKR
jgi:hypothetical protein